MKKSTVRTRAQAAAIFPKIFLQKSHNLSKVWNVIRPTSSNMVGKQTMPKPLYTEATLLAAMERAGSCSHSIRGIQRQSGLAQRRLTLPFMRATNVHFRTAFSAGLVPPLRQMLY